VPVPAEPELPVVVIGPTVPCGTLNAVAALDEAWVDVMEAVDAPPEPKDAGLVGLVVFGEEHWRAAPGRVSPAEAPRRGETGKAVVVDVVTVAVDGGMVGSFRSLSMSLFILRWSGRAWAGSSS
jgi:hypothetical protein